jgi:sec-independent protein translocase protein TatB
MFGDDTSELLIVAVLALIYIGPKDLPRAMMMVGRWVGKARGYARHFTAGIENVVREAELEEMERKWRDENQRILAQYPADAHYPEPVPAKPDGAPMTALYEDEPTLPLEAPAAPDDDPRPIADRELP